MPYKDKEKQKQQKKQYYEKNKEEIKRKSRDYKKRNKKKIKAYMKKYYPKNKIKMLENSHKNSRIRHDKINFGGNREEALKRDKWRCRECGMTNKAHLKIYGKEITIHHKDGLGTKSKIKNNDLENLITLCLRCHGKEPFKNKCKEVK